MVFIWQSYGVYNAFFKDKLHLYENSEILFLVAKQYLIMYSIINVHFCLIKHNYKQEIIA